MREVGLSGNISKKGQAACNTTRLPGSWTVELGGEGGEAIGKLCVRVCVCARSGIGRPSDDGRFWSKLLLQSWPRCGFSNKERKRDPAQTRPDPKPWTTRHTPGILAGKHTAWAVHALHMSMPGVYLASCCCIQCNLAMFSNLEGACRRGALEDAHFCRLTLVFFSRVHCFFFRQLPRPHPSPGAPPRACHGRQARR